MTIADVLFDVHESVSSYEGDGIYPQGYEAEIKKTKVILDACRQLFDSVPVEGGYPAIHKKHHRLLNAFRSLDISSLEAAMTCTPANDN